jgi:hypothetical protein
MTNVVGMPPMYPPKELDGFVVAGGPEMPDSGFTSPKSVEGDPVETFDSMP